MSARNLLEIADELRAIAASGLHFTEGEFDRERYARLQSLAARLANLSGAGAFEPLEELFRTGDRGYVTPKIDTRLAVFRGERVLLVRERSDGRWSLPGGFVDVGDSPSSSAVREMSEEAGVAARVTGLAGVFDNRLNPLAPAQLFQVFKLVFTGELIDPSQAPSTSAETDAVEYHSLETLPELSPGRTLETHIRYAYAFSRGEQTSTHYD